MAHKIRLASRVNRKKCSRHRFQARDCFPAILGSGRTYCKSVNQNYTHLTSHPDCFGKEKKSHLETSLRQSYRTLPIMFVSRATAATSLRKVISGQLIFAVCKSLLVNDSALTN